jgi:hypothetical protein
MRTSTFIALTFPLALLFAAPTASAQPVDAATKSAARAVAEDALKLYDKADYAGAYEKANRANELVHAPTMALLTGRCLEKLGRLVEASEKYLEASHDTLEPGASPAQKSAQTEADKARTAILPRIPAVELALDPPAPDARVLLDNKHVPAAMIGIKRPIDPGKHTVSVARGGESATQEFTLNEADSVRIVLKAPKRAGGPAYYPPSPGQRPQPLPQPPPPPQAQPQPQPQPVLMYAPRPAPEPVPPPVVMKRRSTGLFVTGVILIPVGAIAALAGTAMVLLNDSTETAGSFGEGDSTSTGAGSGLVVLGVGAALLTGGIIMTVVGGKKVPVEPNAALLDPRHSPPAPRASVTPLFGPVSGVRVQF